MSLWSDYKGSVINPLNLFLREDPMREANRYLKDIPGVGENFYSKYIQQGDKAGSTLSKIYSDMLSPTSFIDNIMKNYSMSKGAQYQKDQLSRGIGSTAAAGGYAGTPEHMREFGEMADKIMSGDMQQYLQNALNVMRTGMGGEQDFYNKGYDSTRTLADLIGNTLSSQAGLSFQNANQQNAQRDAFFNALIKALSSGAGASLG